MSFLSSFVSTKARDLHDGAIKMVAKWDPETVAESQITEWDSQARELAATAAKAVTEAKTANDAVATLPANVARYTAAAEKLMAAGNETSANQAADSALEYQSRLESAQAEAADATLWAAETRAAAENAERLVLEGRSRVEAARRDQARAQREAQIAESRLHERERVAGISRGLSGADAALDAMKANAQEARERAEADRIRGNVLGKAVDKDAAINAALAEVDGKAQPVSLADKLARLKK